MRLKIYLRSENSLINIPFNYNHILSAIIYDLIDDVNFANELHSKCSFKFFCFSQLNISRRKMVKGGFISQDGNIDFIISSPNDKLISELVNGIMKKSYIKFVGQKLVITKCEILQDPVFSSKMEFKTLSPIIVTTKKLVEGQLKEWDLAPSDDFFRGVEKNLIKKYLLFNNLASTDKTVCVYSDMRNVKRKRISINKHDSTTFHRAYMMDIIIKSDVDLIKFAYDSGLGSKNSMGFGLLDIY